VIVVKHHYPFAPLAALMGLSEHQAAMRLGISGSTEQRYRREGMSEKVADRLAVRAHLHPFEVWPEMIEHTAVDLEAAELVAMERRRKRWRDNKRAQRLRDPENLDVQKRLYRQDATRAIAVYKAQWNRQNADRVAEHSRAYRARRAAERRESVA
jgi:hypothetical protein